MAANDYQFTSHWRLHGSLDEIVTIMADPRGLPQWWPSVYLDVQELVPGDERGIGKVFDLHTRGWLPYALRWQLKVVEVGDHSLTIEAAGDFTGRGIWRAVQEGPCVSMTYDWNIRANKPLLRHCSALLKPIFAANHRWAMAQGERSLQREVERRRSSAPPSMPPKGSSLGAWTLGLTIGGAGTYLLRRMTRRRRAVPLGARYKEH